MQRFIRLPEGLTFKTVQSRPRIPFCSATRRATCLEVFAGFGLQQPPQAPCHAARLGHLLGHLRPVGRAKQGHPKQLGGGIDLERGKVAKGMEKYDFIPAALLDGMD